MNQRTLTPNHPQITRLPLAKFSHTTTTIDHGGLLSWNHINSTGDLTCILELLAGGGATLPRLVIRIARNDGILEQLDLSHFSHMLAAQSQSGQSALQAKAPFAVVVKSPCLAVKYPHSSTHIRRFQIKFCQSTDYFTALALLSQANCPFTEGSTATQPPGRPPTASSWASFHVPGVASNAGSTTITSDNETTVPYFPMPGYMPSGLTTPHPPSSSSSTMFNLITQNAQAQCLAGPTDVQQLKKKPAKASAKQKASGKANPRPATAPAYHGQQLDEMLPPRRDLPFLKSSQKKSQKEEKEGSQASQLSQATPTEQIIDVSRNQQSVLPVNQTVPVCPESQVPDSQVSDSQSQFIAPTQPYLDPFCPAPSSQRQDTQLGKYLSHGSTEQQNVVSGVETIPCSQELDEDVTATTDKGSKSAIPEDQLSAYLSAPTAERVALLENWMCDLIEDDKFMVLCQDVESTWKRFAFGMREKD
ncbi:uncharacterized protein N7483_008790 [Penicillium malachiteum]|uniref:uncharacterized protein n=1 Tax=Penicillium malachiteum TaxID=1324776 RepID=UPI0025491208|nr:uncharacterized protein N7483_008790 [Penicillium malachiteum]KAJ5720856.1 hypothetical protein N7483_008790 [Penicillium malachiteum]